MRPTRLELAGFTAFRDPVKVDFDGAELFALSGPTGAGKSALIDSLCFALYGSVPRLDRRSVAPVISTGKLEARVRFDFTVANRPYTAVRVVRALSSGGASTKEARLESADEVIAGDADGVTKAVEALLGLEFEQFTKSVVLPQGEFARFLHDTPRGRQDLLVRLLELGVYTQMRQAAHMREEAAKASATLIGRQLEALAHVTPERLSEVERRLAMLQTLRSEIEDTQPRLDELADQQRTAETERAEADKRAEPLEAVRLPEGVADLADEATAAVKAAEAADIAADEAERRVAAADAAVRDLPDRTELERARQQYEQRAALAERIANGTPILAAARDEEQKAHAALELAEQRLGEAQAALDIARRAHAAEELAAHLEPGAPCPVCEQRVERVPDAATPADVNLAQEAAAAADRARAEAAAALRHAGTKRGRTEQTMEDLRSQEAALEEALSGRPGPDDIARLIEGAAAAEQALEQARRAERTARATARKASAAAEGARKRRDEAWSVFDAARDRVAVSGPPAPDRADLVGSWHVLATWAGEEGARQRERSARAATRSRYAARERATLEEQLHRRCDEVGLDLASRSPRDVSADALAATRAKRDEMERDLARRETCREEQQTHLETVAVAHGLAQHLRSNRFEQWLLDEALTRLAEGASDILRGLSGGQYSLDVDGQRNFAVIDHLSAGERRPARTLSGGETFLASLALALTLAEHLAEMTVASGPRLESIFLDEGFGTLDPATLDVVATAIEELSAGGRTVGIVTHVRDLAERMPVRFEVSKGPATSTVERVVT